MWGVGSRILTIPLNDAGGPKKSYVGGMRLKTFNATLPLIRLDLFEDALRMRSSIRLLNRLIPIWEARFEELSEIRAIGGSSIFTSGIRFRACATSDWVIFWTGSRPKVLSGLEALGLNVNRDPLRLNIFNPGRER
jgi:hypothetical protein